MKCPQTKDYKMRLLAWTTAVLSTLLLRLHQGKISLRSVMQNVSISLQWHKRAVLNYCNVPWLFLKMSIFPDPKLNSLTFPWPSNTFFTDHFLICDNPDCVGDLQSGVWKLSVSTGNKFTPAVYWLLLVCCQNYTANIHNHLLYNIHLSNVLGHL